MNIRKRFEKNLLLKFKEAEKNGLSSCDIRAGDLHKEIGGYPDFNRMPICCGVMRKMMNEEDQVLTSPPKGDGANLKMRYKIPYLKRKYWVELYWPAKNRDLSCLYVWFHEKKISKIHKMQSGDKVLFYEVAKRPGSDIRGSKTMFASGTIIDKVLDISKDEQMRGGKRWVHLKPVITNYAVEPKKGIPLDEVKSILGMKSLPQLGFQIDDREKFKALENAIKAKEEAISKITKIPNIKPGSIITNSELCKYFHCSPQGGMRRSKKTNTLIVISDNIKSIYEDKWHDETLHYTGMGQAGDQSLNFAQNKTLNESGSNGVDVHLFEVFKKNEYVYQGRVELVANPYHEKQLDKDGKLRKVWMFPLKIIDGKVLSIKRDLLIAKQNQAEKRARKLSEKELLKRIKNLSKKAGCRTVSGNQYERNAYVAELARKRSNGVCQLCDSSAPFKNKAGEPFLEVHHIIWLSRNGDDTIDNTVALCPNCHRRMHILDKKADKDKLLIRLEVNKQ